jgi:hypothetical protein
LVAGIIAAGILVAPGATLIHAGTPEGNQPAGSNKVESRRIFRGVPPRNPDFMGRDAELANLHRILFDAKRPAAITQAAIHGMGGIGKTSLAAEYAHSYRDSYESVWWAPAEEKTILLNSLADLARLLDPAFAYISDAESAARAALDSLAASNRPWLIVYDNVSNPDDIRNLIPSAGARLLVTTRWANWGGRAMELEVDVWHPTTACAFLLQHVKQAKPRAARQLAKAVGYLPLALDHAASYLRFSGITTDRYIARLNELIAEAPEKADYPASVFATFNLAIKKAAERCPAAEVLLGLFAVLAPERVPLSLVESFGISEKERDEAIKILSVVSLVKHVPFSDGDAAILMHRLVRAVMRARLALSDDLASTTNRAIEGLGLSFPANAFRDTKSWPQCKKILPHVLALRESADDGRVRAETLVALLFNAARYLHGESALKQAERVYRDAIAMGGKALGTEHPAVIRHLTGLSNLLRDAARFEEAEGIAREVITLSQRANGPLHLTVAEGFNSLAMLLRDMRQLGEAESLLHKAISIGEQTVGRDTFAVAVSLNILGTVFGLSGRHAEAEPLFREAIGIGEKALGPGHPDIGTWQHNLAILLCETNRHAEAEPILRDAIAAVRPALGEEHPNSARLRSTLSKVLLATNRSEDAYHEAHLALSTLSIADKALGRSHPWTKEAAIDLAKACLALGRLAEAAEIRAHYEIEISGKMPS